MSARSKCAGLIRQTGFTLVEMLVAIGLLALLSAIAFRALDSSLMTQHRLSGEYARWRTVDLAFRLIAEDLSQLIHLRWRSGAASQPSFHCKQGVDAENPADTNLHVVRFASSLGRDDGGVLPSFRVGYRLQNETLWRLQWAAVDEAAPVAPASFPVLDAVQSFRCRFLDDVGKVHETWTAGAVVPPTAIEIALIFRDGRAVSRLFALSPALR